MTAGRGGGLDLHLNVRRGPGIARAVGDGAARRRAAVAAYLARTRGVRGDAGSVVVTAGFSHALAVLARALRTLGADGVATEDPGLGRHRDLLRANGLRVTPLPVRESGAEPDGWGGDSTAALLTPGHQHPYGLVLTPRHRTAFVQLARRRAGFLIEDDYDGEFRYDRQPVGALQALAPENVVFAGSTSKALAPGVRLGWLVVPPDLRTAVVDALRDLGALVPVVDRLVLADLLERGDYDRHIRKARLTYRRHRTELAHVAEHLGHPLTGVPAGLHALMPLTSAAEERRLTMVADYAGLKLHGLHTSNYWHQPTDTHPAALVLGYATPPGHTGHRALETLTEVVDAAAE